MTAPLTPAGRRAILAARNGLVFGPARTIAVLERGGYVLQVSRGRIGVLTNSGQWARLGEALDATMKHTP